MVLGEELTADEVLGDPHVSGEVCGSHRCPAKQVPSVRIIENSSIPELDDDVFFEVLRHNAFGSRHRDEVTDHSCSGRDRCCIKTIIPPLC